MIRFLKKAIVLVVVLTIGYLGVTFAQVWWASSRDDQAPSSAIIVLGAAQYNGKPSPVLKARLDHAADLYLKGVAKTVVVTGGMQQGDRVGEGRAGYDYLRAKGVPDSALKVEVEGHDTYEELAASAHILTEARLGTSAVIVSSPYHAYRALAIAQEVGLEAHFSSPGDDTPFPSLVRETAGAAAGRIIGYRRLSNLQ
jgi:uncharacterized SAM-binding protein YcdF (DUF218 family)